MEVTQQTGLRNFKGELVPLEKQWGFYLPIEKIDKAERLVYGWASVATVDGKALKDMQGEIVPVDAIKAAMPGWLEWGGPIRVMHQPIAAGTTKHAQIIEGPDKDKEGLYIGAFIGDNDAWQKVQDEILRGFSIGGEKLEKIGDTVTKLNLYEVSLVDRPANQACRIDLFKAAGTGVSSAVGLSKGWSPEAVDVVQFDRREVGMMGRIIAKLSAGKIGKADIPNPEDWGRQDFSSTAAAPAPVDHGNVANAGALGPGTPLPSILTQPGGTPVPSSEAYLNDIPPRDQNRILMMSGKVHVFGRDGWHLASFPGDDAGKLAAAKVLKEHIEKWDAKKMVGNAAKKAKKIAKRDRKMMMKALKRIRRDLEKPAAERQAIEKGLLDTLKERGLLKAEISTADVNDLPDSEFAYIEEGGTKDSEGKTTPRSLRHLPIPDAAHCRNAAARLSQTDIPAEAKAKAHKKIKARGKKFGVEISNPSDKGLGLSKNIVDTISELRTIQADIVAEGMEEGGDPKDLQQAQDLGEVIEDLREEVLGHAAEIESLFPADDGSFAN